MRHSFKMTASALLIAVSFGASNAVGEEIVTDPDLIRQAQKIMYNLNYDFGTVDGKLGPATRKVIRTIQRKLNMAETGNLSVGLLLELRKQKIPTIWGALSAAVDGGWGATWNYETRRSAERKAKQLCRSKSKKTCRVLAVYDQQCAAAYHWDGKDRWGWRGSSADDLSEAKQNALTDCRAHRSESVPCELLTAICANGSHKN